MKHLKLKYFLRLIVFGFIIVLLIISLGIISLVSVNNFNIYDLGVFVIYAGIIISVVSFLFVFSSSSWKIRLQSYLPLEMRGQGVRDPYKDFLFTVLISGLCLLLTGFILVGISQAYGYRKPESGAGPSVSLLRGELELYMPYAKEWQEDAFLSEADILIGDNLPWLILADFRSLTNLNEYLVIGTDSDGAIRGKTYSIDPHLEYIPISDDDWVLDSQDAIDIFVQDPDIRFCINSSLADTHYFNRIRLSLTRWYRLSLLGDPVVWRLGLPNRCPDVDYYYLLDAYTGELIYDD